MTTEQPPAPIVHTESLVDIARGLYVIPDNGVPLVPNIGIVEGDTAVLVVDTGMGPRNGSKVLKVVEDIANGRKIYLTSTHFHPEHSFGSSIFKPVATLIMNDAQILDVKNKGSGYLDFFRSFGQSVADELENVTFPEIDIRYSGNYTLDLGGRIVTFNETGQAHTLGDQIIRVPDVGAVFCGDLVEESQFSIFPWFPPDDSDVSGIKWLKVIEGMLKAGDSVVIPGHGRVSDKHLLEEVHVYLTFLKDEVWTRKKAGIEEAQVISEVEALALAAHPTWVGSEWIEKGVQCLCSEFDRSAK